MQSSTNVNNASDRKRVLAKAKGILGAAGNRLGLIQGLLALALGTVSVLLIVSAVAIVIDLEGIYSALGDQEILADVAFLLAEILLLLFLVYPLYLGVMMMAVKMQKNETASVADLFWCFDSARAYRRGMGILFRTLLRSLPFWLVCGLSMAAAVLTLDSLYIAVGYVTLPLVCLGIFSTARSYPFVVLALGNPDVPLGDVMRMALRSTKRRFWSIFVFRMQRFAYFVISLVSIGVITLLHTLPMNMIATAEYGRALALDSANEDEPTERID